MIMVGLPALLIIFGATVTAVPDPGRQLDGALGNAQARITVGDAQLQVGQDPTMQAAGTAEQQRPARTVPGHPAGSDWTADQITSLVHADVVPAVSGTIGLKADRWVRVAAGYLPASAMQGSGLIRLRSGRWPTGDREALVTADGRQNHQLEIGQQVEVRPPAGGPAHQVTIVGRAAPPADNVFGAVPDGELIVGRSGLVEPLSRQTSTFLVEGGAPVTWSTVRRLNQYGLTVLSRAVVDHPPPDSQVDPQFGLESGSTVSSAGVAFAVLTSAGILFEAMLLAGPAFAITAARQRHAMALLVGNGADRRQLRRQLLAQALLLGVLAGVVGAALGAIIGRYFAVVTARFAGRWDAPNPITWWQPLLVAAAAAVASTVSALLPARGLGRLNASAALRGRSEGSTRRRLRPVLGGLCLVVGLAVAVVAGFFGPPSMPPRYLLGGGFGVATIGAMLLTPAVLDLLGRLSGPLPLALRLALRDAVRHSGRTAPAVAAVIIATGMFVLLAIVVPSESASSARSYQPTTTIGWGVVTPQSPAAGAATEDEITRQHPDWVIEEHRALGTTGGFGNDLPDPVVGFVPPGCSATEVATGAGVGTCVAGRTDDGVTIGVVTEQELAASDLDPAVRTFLKGGGVLINQAAFGEENGRLTDVSGVFEGDTTTLITAAAGSRTVPAAQQHRLQVKIVRPDVLDSITQRAGQHDVGMITAETAARLKVPAALSSMVVHDPAGPISSADERKINEVVPNSAELVVEHGYQDQLTGVLTTLVAIAAGLALMAALVSTALAQAEARPDIATLTAVGGRPGTRRRLAAAQAASTVIIGSVIGIVIGGIAGVAFADSVTRESLDGSDGATSAVIRIAWQQVIALPVGVTVLAALIAVLGAWRSPRLTRRLD